MQTDKQLNKPVKTFKKSRNPNGQAKPYKDGNRWKAIDYLQDIDGNRCKVMGTGSTAKAAQSKLQENLKKKRAEFALNRLPIEFIYVADYCTYWLEEVKLGHSQLSYKTLANYQSSINTWIRPHLGHIKLSALTRQNILNLFTEMVRQGKSRSAQVQVKSILEPALAEAVDAGYISESPYKKVRLLPKQAPYPAFFDFAAAKALLGTASNQGSSLRWDIALTYGLRQGEALGLTWDDIDLESSEPNIRVTKQIQRQTGKGLVLEQLKTIKSNRVIPLDDATVSLFTHQRKANETAKVVHGDTWNVGNFVFTSSAGTPVDPANDRKAWKKLVALAGVETLRLHDARHSAATLSGDVNVASKLLGHSGIGITMSHYSNVTRARMLASIEAVHKQIREAS
jgi:integrase